MKFAVAFLAFSSFVFAATHYSFVGNDPSGWKREELHRPEAARTAQDYRIDVSDGHTYKVAGIITDAEGNTYVAGSRIVGPATVQYPLSDVFITKLDALGNVVFTVTLGGTGFNQASGLALDKSANIYLAGATWSTGFPLIHTLQSPWGYGSTGFIVKLSPDGGQLLYSTYFGGTSGPSSVNAIAADADGNAYVTGTTNASDSPVTPGLSAGHASMGIGSSAAAFVAKLAPPGDRIVYSGLISGYAVECGCCSECFLSARKTEGGRLHSMPPAMRISRATPTPPIYRRPRMRF